MLNCLVLICAILGQSVSAHFSIEYPEWRGDSFIEPASQYIRPCAGINQTISGNNRTLWPLDGGSLNLEFHHEFTYAFINLGLGSNATVFNISLTTPPLNETGNGTFCFPKVQLPTDLNLQDGEDASIQVVTVGETGTALYNCADITFSSTATLLSGDQCKNDTGIGIEQLKQQINGSTSDDTPSSGTMLSSVGFARSGLATVLCVLVLSLFL